MGAREFSLDARLPGRNRRESAGARGAEMTGRKSEAGGKRLKFRAFVLTEKSFRRGFQKAPAKRQNFAFT
jgi:hypothetical protein